jgi:hypothetical protein
MSVGGGQSNSAQFAVGISHQRFVIAVTGNRFSLHERLSVYVVVESATFHDGEPVFFTKRSEQAAADGGEVCANDLEWLGVQRTHRLNPVSSGICTKSKSVV